MVYVFETAVNLGVTTEDEILPLFYELYTLRKDLMEGNVPAEAVDRIRRKALELFSGLAF